MKSICSLRTPEGVAIAEAAILALVAEHGLPEPVAMHVVPRLGHLSVEVADRSAFALWAAVAAVRVHPADADTHGTCCNEAWAFIDDGNHPDGLHVCLWWCTSPQQTDAELGGAGWQLRAVAGDAA